MKKVYNTQGEHVGWQRAYPEMVDYTVYFKWNSDQIQHTKVMARDEEEAREFFYINHPHAEIEIVGITK